MYRLFAGGIQVGAYSSKEDAYREGWALYNNGKKDAYLITPEGWLYTFDKHPDENPGQRSRSTVRLGSTGDDVVYLQQLLSAAGYSPGPIDGIFGKKTDTAVRSYQQANGLIVDGIVGPNTWSSLLTKTGGSTPPASSLGPLNVPLLLQMPDLPRGCEVTSLAMLLNYAGVSVDKMTLASQVVKIPYWQNGLHGNPYDGFVGDMYDFNNPGYGVYYGPIRDLAEQYLPGRVMDLTGSSFDNVLNTVKNGTPVWIITNARFQALSSSSFEQWNTSSGTVNITWHEHSVVVTGFDSNYVYINDPLDSHGKNKKLSRKPFQAAWEQMGSQAITYRP